MTYRYQDLLLDLPEDLQDVNPMSLSEAFTSADQLFGNYQSHHQNQSYNGGNPMTPGGASAHFSDGPCRPVPSNDGPSTSSGAAASFSGYLPRASYERFSPRDEANLFQHHGTGNARETTHNFRELCNEDGDQLPHQTWHDLTGAVSSQSLAGGFASDKFDPTYNGFDGSDYERFQQLPYPPAPSGMHNHPSPSCLSQYPVSYDKSYGGNLDSAKITHQRLNSLETTTPVGEGAKQKRRNRLKKEVYENMSAEELEQRKKNNARIASQVFRRKQKQLTEEYNREYEQLKRQNYENHQMLAELEKLKVLYIQQLSEMKIEYQASNDAL